MSKDSTHYRNSGNWYTAAALYLAIPMALFSALWVSAGRSVFGAGGDLVLVFAVSFGPLLLVLQGLALYFAFREAGLAGAGVRGGTTPAVATTLYGTWLMALIFGLLVPDRIEGRTVSAAASIFGEDFIGLSAGFGNTFGILTFSFAVAALICSYSAFRRARRLALGITAEDVEAAARASSRYEFLDD